MVVELSNGITLESSSVRVLGPVIMDDGGWCAYFEIIGVGYRVKAYPVSDNYDEKLRMDAETLRKEAHKLLFGDVHGNAS